MSWTFDPHRAAVRLSGTIDPEGGSVQGFVTSVSVGARNLRPGLLATHRVSLKEPMRCRSRKGKIRAEAVAVCLRLRIMGTARPLRDVPVAEGGGFKSVRL